MRWRRECQSIPIERQSIFDLLGPKPPFELPPENGISPSTKAIPPNGPSSTIVHQATSERQTAVAPLSLIGVEAVALTK